MEKVCIIGLGYVGLPLACRCVSKGFTVIGADIDKNKIKLIASGKSPIDDKKLKKNLKNTYSKMKLSDNISESCENSDIIIVCVPTPVNKDNTPDLTPLQNSLTEISKTLSKNQLIIIESTIYPGLTEDFAKPILEKSGLSAYSDFHLVHCPERINPGDSKWSVENIPRVVGGLSPKATKLAAEFYRKIIDAEVMEMSSVKEAEATKILENTFRDINIAFINELAKSFDALDINIYEVIRGASTKPFAFMPHYPGPGVGGHCIPVDPYYLIAEAKKKKFNHKFLMLARVINESMPDYVIIKTKDALNELGKKLNNSKITVFGLAYKQDVDDLRESPALKIIEKLKKQGADVKSYDPHVSISELKNQKDALRNANCVIIATGHSEFRKIKAGEFKSAGVGIVIDSHKIYDRKKFEDAGLIYKGIGQ